MNDSSENDFLRATASDEATPAEDDTRERKPCPFCGEAILAVAKKCRFCHAILDDSYQPVVAAPLSTFDRMATPEGRPTSAIISGYAGLFAILPVFGLPAAIAAVWCGMVALRKIRKDPALAGRGRAYFGIAVGGVMIVVSCFFLALVVFESLSRNG